MVWESLSGLGIIKYYTPVSTCSGKELTFWLDPEKKVTFEDYQSEQQVNLWEKETVNIP